MHLAPVAVLALAFSSFRAMATEKTGVGVTLSTELDKPWRMTADEHLCAGAEFESVCDSLDKCVVDPLKKRKRLQMLDVYVLGDFYGQRTQIVMVALPTHLDSKFISEMQAFLGRECPNWRIAVCVPQIRWRLVVYSNALVCNGRLFEDPRQVMSELAPEL